MFQRIKQFLAKQSTLTAELAKELPPVPPTFYKYKLIEEKEDYGRGLVVWRFPDNKFFDWETLPHSDGLEVLKVAGVFYRPDILQSKVFKPGNSILLVPEPDNPHDQNAIAVYDAEMKYRVGYIPARTNKRILQKMEQERFSCISMWEMRSEGKRVGLRLLLIDEETLPRVKASELLLTGGKQP